MTSPKTALLLIGSAKPAGRELVRGAGRQAVLGRLAEHGLGTGPCTRPTRCAPKSGQPRSWPP